MSGDRNKPDPYKAEHEAAGRQNGTLDAFARATSLATPFGSARGFHFGKTDFEGYDLNDMIDIVESAGPELLEDAGRALVDAHKAIKAAAAELKTNLGNVDWEGEAHQVFTKWGESLVNTAEDLAGYAHVVGTQIMATSSGLSSVRKSMPPRDDRTHRTTVDDIPAAKRVESNDEYTAALKAEKHRQEAINQMYRLASFYTVSHGTMAKAEEPVFPKMPDVGVPPPEGWVGVPSPGHEQPGALTGTKGFDRSQPDALASTPPAAATDDPGTSLGPHVGTEIDSVGTLPKQETAKPTTGAPPLPSGPSAPSVSGVPPVPLTAAPPVRRGRAGRAPQVGGVPGGRGVTSAQGRAGGLPGSTPAGRAGNALTGPAGRNPAPGTSGGRQAGPMGRGLVGGASNTGAPASRQPGSTQRGPVTGSGPLGSGRTGAGRSMNGVVGGTPVVRQGGGDSGGARVPRGTVIGGEDRTAPRSAGERPGRRGVIGSPQPTPDGPAAHRPPARPQPAADTPNDRTPETGNSRRVSPDTGGRPSSGNRQKNGESTAPGEGRSGNPSSTD